MKSTLLTQVWHFYFGRPVIVTEISLEGKLTETTLGADIAAGQKCQYTVPPGVWFGARSKEPDAALQGPLGQIQEVKPTSFKKLLKTAWLWHPCLVQKLSTPHEQKQA